MNKELSKYAREEIKKGLVLLPDTWQTLFKRMYGQGKGQDINEVIDTMPEDKLDWAMTQIKNSIKKIEELK